MFVNNKSRVGILLSLTVVILLYAPIHAFSDSSKVLQALGGLFKKEYFFLGDKYGCYDGEKIVNFSFDAIEGKTKLDIPINYLLNSDNWNGVVHLWIQLGLEPETLEPYCDKALPLVKAGVHFYEPSFPKPMRIHISNWGNGGLTMEEKIQGEITRRNGITAYSGDSGEYSIFKAPANHPSYKEYLVPNTNAMGVLYFIECNSIQPKGNCKMNFHYKDRLNIEINFNREKIADLGKIYKSTVSLLDKFSANP